MAGISPDEELLEHAQAFFQEERLLAAARLLRQVKDPSCLTDFHHKLLQNAKICEQAVADLLSPPSEGWKKQGESHGKFDASIYYKLEAGARMTCRMETPIPSSLLVPLLSVLNESSLYHTWIPSWTRPVKLGVRQSNKLLNDTRTHQIIQVQCDVPWPMSQREVLIDALALDDIDEQGFIAVKMRTLAEDSQDLPAGFSIPTLEKNMERIDLDGAILFRSCPRDHPNFTSMQEKTDEELILVQLTVFFDAHMPLAPQAMINFITRTVMGHIWAMLLHVAEDVRDGKRPEHKEAIDANADFYKWVDERILVMLDGLKNGDKKSDKKCEPTEWTLLEALTVAA
jgi:hypothetical protein